MAIFTRKNQPGFEVNESTTRDAFLGTLRSELDGDAALEGAFAELYARFGALRDSYDNGRLDVRAFGLALRDLRVIDTDGYQWTIGATTGKWYRRNQQEGMQWASAPVPAGKGTLVDHTGQASGWAVEDWEQRRARRLREDAERARDEENRRAAAPTAKRKMSIEEMFDKYVEVAEEVPTYSVDSTILVVEELPELPPTPPAADDETEA